MLSLLLGCGLRRAELTGLTVDHLQQRDEHWAIINLFGKGRPCSNRACSHLGQDSSGSMAHCCPYRGGSVFRRVSRIGTVRGPKISEKLVWWVVRERAKAAGIEKLAPHDLRRTCARLCHAAGGELEQIQFLLGYRSVETTERYLGCRQRLTSAVNDKIGIEPTSGAP